MSDDKLQAAKDRTNEMLDDAIAARQMTAFPVYDGGVPLSDGMTLRDYFAAHAPAKPWPHFEPVMPAKPTEPSREPVDNDGRVAPTDILLRNLREWLCDHGCWDPRTVDGYRHFSNWCDAWDSYWGARGEWERRFWIEHAEQWPWFYADTMLKRRGS